MATFIKICTTILVKKKGTKKKISPQTKKNPKHKPYENSPVKIDLGSLSYDLPKDRGDTSLQGHEHAVMLLEDFHY